MAGLLLRLVKALVAPPACLFLLGAVGLLLARRRKRLGLSLCAGAAAGLYVLCCPWVGGMLLWSLQSHPALPPEGAGELPPGAGAVVVLAAGWDPYAPEFGGDTVDPLTLERLRYAARLARRTGLPVLTSGGVPEPYKPSMAELMADVLARDLGVEARWTEGVSGDTRTNARFSAPILFGAGVERVFLVTHAWHMPRAVAAFRAAGIEPIPAPTGFRIRPRLERGSFWPTARALRESTWGLHEWLGRVWYVLTG